MKSYLFSNKLLFIGIALLVMLVGCSNANQTDSAGGGNTSAQHKEAKQDVSYPITIKHAFGETVIKAKPERVATIAWANHDVALALGVVPVGFSAANYGVQDESGLLPWTAKRLEELGVAKPNIFQDTAGLDFEAISDSEPDIILAAYSGITQEEYDTLSQIAPVVAYPTVPWVISWRDQVRMNALGMGMQDEGEQLIKDVEALIANTAAQYPELQGVKAAFTYFNPADLSSFYVYATTDPRGEFLLELGMEFPESVQAHITPDTGFALSLSAEHADALNDADILIAYGDQALLNALQADPLFGSIPAIKRGSMVLIENDTPLAAAGNPNPLSIAYTTDEYVQLIAEAINKLNEQ